MDQRLLFAIADVDVASNAAALASEGDGLDVVATVSEPDEVARTLRRQDVDVVVLHDALGTTPVLTLAREIAAGFPEVGLVLIAEDESPALMRSAMQAGLRDVLTLPLTFDALEAGVRNAAQWSRALRERVSVDETAASGLGGQLIAVAGSKGGVGTTTVALQLALAATRAAPGKPVCLADFDMLTGDLRTLLDTPPRRSVADLVEVASELTVRHLQETLYSHPAGIRLLLAPEEGERGEDVTNEVSRNVLDAVRSRHALTIVDCGSSFSEASVAAIEAASRLIIVTTPDILALRGVHRMRELLRRLQARETDDAMIVLNRTSRKLEVQPDVARRVVGGQFAQTTIPADFAAFEPAVNTGQPGRLTDQKVLQAFDKLAAELDAVPDEDDDVDMGVEDDGRGGGGGLLSRLTGERGQSSAEFLGMLPLVLVTAVVIWQMALTGFTYVMAGNAAREGARELATNTSEKPKGNPPYRRQAAERLPGAWRKDADIKRVENESKVTVKLKVPVLFPGVVSPIQIASTSGSVIEDEDLDDDYTSKRSATPEPQ